MDKSYMVYEGHYEPMDWEHEYSEDILVAIYPLEDMARHHLELWASKMLPDIYNWNDEESRRLKERIEDGADEEYEYNPWIPIPNNKDERKWAFVNDDEEVYCYYTEHEVLQEVRLE